MKDIQTIELDCSVTTFDEINGKLTATELWLNEANSIIVRWVDENGADYSSYLHDEEEDVIFEIIKSIK